MITEGELRLYRQYFDFAKEVEASGKLVVDEYAYLNLIARRLEFSSDDVMRFLKHRRNANATDAIEE